MKCISLLLPVFNEERCVASFFQALEEVKKKLFLKNVELELIFIDDGSTDRTIENIQRFCSNNNTLVIQFSRNFGKEAAILAGIEAATGHAVIPYDIDMQDPLELIVSMTEEWVNGAKRVVARRKDRSLEYATKRIPATLYHWLIKQLSESPTDKDAGDFQLLDREVVTHFTRLKERVRYSKGLFSWLGFSPVMIDYTRQERVDGKSKFSVSKLIELAVNATLSFSTKPIRMIAISGFFISLFSFFLGIKIFLDKTLGNVDVPGYSSIAVMIAFFSGVQILFLGIIGLYIGTVVIETKARPLFIINKTIKFN